MHFRGAHQGRQLTRDREHRFRLARLPLGTLFNIIPIAQNLLGARYLDLAEHMRMPLNKLFAHAVRHVFKGEGTLLRLHLGMKDDLHEHITQLLAEQSLILLIDRLNYLIGLFDQIFFDAFMRLLPIPWAAALGTQALHNLKQIADPINILERKPIDHLQPSPHAGKMRHEYITPSGRIFQVF